MHPRNRVVCFVPSVFEPVYTVLNTVEAVPSWVREFAKLRLVPSAVPHIGIAGRLPAAAQPVHRRVLVSRVVRVHAQMITGVHRRRRPQRLEQRRIPPDRRMRPAHQRPRRRRLHKPVVLGDIGRRRVAALRRHEQQPELITGVQTRRDQLPVMGHHDRTPSVSGIRRRRRIHGCRSPPASSTPQPTTSRRVLAAGRDAQSRRLSRTPPRRPRPHRPTPSNAPDDCPANDPSLSKTSQYVESASNATPPAGTRRNGTHDQQSSA